jgi:cell division protein ZapD
LVLYEYPFNESIRTMLRLEHLFKRLTLLVPRDEPVDHHFALVTVFEIMDVASRADLKSDILKELERHRGVLLGYRGNPHISEAALDEVIGQIDEAHQALNNQAGKAGQALTANEWLMSIRSRISIPGAPANSTCRPTSPGSSIRPKPAARIWPAGSTRCGR